MKLDMPKIIGYILFGVGIVGGVESFTLGGSTGRVVAGVAMLMIIAGSVFLGMKTPKKR